MTKDDLDISKQPFARKPETEAEAEARRKKHAPKDDSKGLKVITPPDPKISAAIAKDFAETKKKEKLAAVKADVERLRDGKTNPFKNVKAFVEKGQAAQKAVDAIIASAATKKKNDAWKAIKPPKKAGSLVEKAIKARDELHAKAKTSKSANSVKTAKPKKKDSAQRAARKGSHAAKVFTDANIKKAAEMIKRKGGALSSDLQKACNWKAIDVRRFVRDIARKRLAMRVICDRSTGLDSTYRL